MNQNENYQALCSRIRQFGSQLGNIESISQQKDFNTVRRKIEEHFERCIHALEARANSLLTHLDSLAEEHYNRTEIVQNKLEKYIQDCDDILATGSRFFSDSPTVADHIWKGALNLEQPNIDKEELEIKLEANLTDEIFSIIDGYGEALLQATAELESKMDNSEATLLTKKIEGVVVSSPPPRFSKADMVTTFAVSGGRVFEKVPKINFEGPCGMYWNPLDDCLYICDYGSSSIKKVTMQGEISTMFSGPNINRPCGIVMNRKENTFLVTNWTSNSISKISSSGMVTIFAGNGNQGNEDGVGEKASFNHPYGIAIDSQTGNIFIGDNSNRLIRKITPSGEVSTLAGSVRGFEDGKGNIAKFGSLWGMCFDERNQSILVCDKNNDQLRRVDLDGNVSTLCSIPALTSVAITENGKFLVTSSDNQIFSVTPQGNEFKVEVLAGYKQGMGGKGELVEQIPLSRDGKHDFCCFNNPCGIAVHEASHSCFIADSDNNTIRKISFV